MPRAALELVLDLETRGFRLHVDGEALVVSGPARKLSDGDREAIRQWKPHVLALLAYKPPDVH